MTSDKPISPSREFSPSKMDKQGLKSLVRPKIHDSDFYLNPTKCGQGYNSGSLFSFQVMFL